jgi:hypothetical protein
MLKEIMMQCYEWLYNDMRNACAIVYSCLDNTEGVINAVLHNICYPVNRFSELIS